MVPHHELRHRRRVVVIIGFNSRRTALDFPLANANSYSLSFAKEESLDFEQLEIAHSLFV
jgi:hypothetical protein